MLVLSAGAYREMVGHCYDGYPYEACGLIAGDGAASANVCYPMANAARSSRVYALDPREHLRVERDAENRGLEVIGVFHSHTHTDAYPLPTDIAQAPDPGWHYVIVSLRDEGPSVRSYRIAEGTALEEPVVLG
jgi:proteasome lid subunit RPN8/RPN11